MKEEITSLNDIELYGPVYRGTKVTYNSKRQRGEVVEGIAIDLDKKDNLVIIRDRENFPHCISLLTIKQV